MTIPTDDGAASPSNLDVFRECFSVVLVRQLAPETPKTKKKRRKSRKSHEYGGRASLNETVEDPSTVQDAAELAEFVEYLAKELYVALPEELRDLSYNAVRNDKILAARYSDPLAADDIDHLLNRLAPSSTDTLATYTSCDVRRVIATTLNAYVTAVIYPPPAHQPDVRATECELCQRSWIPLTYHHLIPRQVAAKAVKRGWCEEWETSKVAWLCRACHSFVHGLASNEVLARDWNSVELLAEREDTKKWVQWVGKVRWKSR